MIDITDNSFAQHGGNLSFIAKNFPEAPKPYIDLSTGINPYYYHITDAPELVKRLPDSTEMEEALNTAANYYGTSAKNINIASGMQPLMFAIASLRRQEMGAANVNILGPTYSEYEKIWKSAGHNVTTVDTIDKLLKADVIIICNPNNPDGRIIKPEILVQLADMLVRKDGWLIVDESFADLTPEISVASLVAAKKNLIVMRSCGKFFGLAGLRVSSVLAPEKISNWLRVVTGNWPISTPACHLLPVIFGDQEWAEQTRGRLANEAELWREVLAKHFTIAGHTTLFTLVESNIAKSWHDKLAKRGILVRRFEHNPRWLRFGLPNVKEIGRIKAALKATS